MDLRGPGPQRPGTFGPFRERDGEGDIVLLGCPQARKRIVMSGGDVDGLAAPAFAQRPGGPVAQGREPGGSERCGRGVQEDDALCLRIGIGQGVAIGALGGRARFRVRRGPRSDHLRREDRAAERAPWQGIAGE